MVQDLKAVGKSSNALLYVYDRGNGGVRILGC